MMSRKYNATFLQVKVFTDAAALNILRDVLAQMVVGIVIMTPTGVGGEAGVTMIEEVGLTYRIS